MAEEQTRKGDPELAERMTKALAYADEHGKANRVVAMEVGVTAQSVVKWKRYGYLAKENIPQFCRACGISIEWFLTGKGDMVEPNPLRSASRDEILAAIRDTLNRREQRTLLRDLAAIVSPD